MYFDFKMDLKENEVVEYFKNIDKDYDGSISPDELIACFAQAQINIESEINTIMENLDIDMSGKVDFSELKIVLTDWEAILKKKTLEKVFETEGGLISVSYLKHELSGILPSEWNEFSKRTKAENGKVSTSNLKNYIKSNLV